MKEIFIIDFFRKNDESEIFFLRCVESLKKLGKKILLVTGGKVTEKMQNSVDYVFYNSDNFLFENFDYEYFQPWDYKTFNQFHIHHSFNFSVQRHGLAVLINIFKSISLAKSLGFTHFHRFLWDCQLGPKSLEFVNRIPQKCHENDKKGFYYCNRNNWWGTQNFPDLKADYFFFEIDFFLSSIPEIKREEDFREVLMQNFGKLKFLITESYLHYFLEKKSFFLLVPDSIEFDRDLPDFYNLGFPEDKKDSISVLNFHPKYNGAITKITKIEGRSDTLLYTQNYSDSSVFRKVVVFYADRRKEVYDNCDPDCWSYLELGTGVISIDVFENDNLIYSENINEVRNYVQFI
jgi:hypothetical protein